MDKEQLIGTILNIIIQLYFHQIHKYQVLPFEYHIIGS